MINTEIFKYECCNNYICLKEVLKMVNECIEKNQINKSDICEYRTENWEEKNIYHYKVTISWYK